MRCRGKSVSIDNPTTALDRALGAEERSNERVCVLEDTLASMHKAAICILSSTMSKKERKKLIAELRDEASFDSDLHHETQATIRKAADAIEAQALRIAELGGCDSRNLELIAENQELRAELDKAKLHIKHIGNDALRTEFHELRAELDALRECFNKIRSEK